MKIFMKTEALVSKNLIFKVYKKGVFCLLFLWTLINPDNSFGAYESYTVRKNANQIIDGASFFVIDGKFADLSSGDFADRDVHTQIHFGVDEKPWYTYTAAFTDLEIDLIVTPYNTSNVAQTPINVTLTISYSPDADEQYVDLDYYELADYHKVKIEIDNITGTIAQNVYLEAILKVDRFYHIDDLNVPSVTAHQVVYTHLTGIDSIDADVSNGSAAGIGEIVLRWDYITGAEEYEVEWTWVDNYGRVESAIPMTIRDFELNNTRIITNQQSYRIPIVYAEGFLLYRIRAVGRWSEPGATQDFDKHYYGKWSTHGATLDHVDDWTDQVEITSVFEALKNWQYQAVYAEFGKKKEIVSFYDGSLRNRQTVTRINSNNEAIVGETIYDNQGRSGIQILPAPVDNPALRYYYKLNRNMADKAYSHNDFDWDDTNEDPCTSISAMLNDVSGAAKYYSDNNSVVGNWQDYVPQSGGYPFVQVEYTPDNTGRIRRQSGVGPDYKIESGHETEYYYLQPYQEELNRLFGYEVGYKTRYKKNMVVDANGQVSISYIDPQGRVIATALGGTNSTGGSAVTPSLLSLGSELTGNHAQQTVDLLNKTGVDDEDTFADDNQLFSTGNYGILNDALMLSTQVNSTDNGKLHEFEYRVRTDVFEDECMPEGTGYPFAYILDLDILDDCAISYLDSDAVVGPISMNILGTHSAGYTSALGTDQTIYFDATLNTGSYALSKVIRIDEDKLDEYLFDYLENNTCLMTLDSFEMDSEIDCGDTLEFDPVTICTVTENMMLADLGLGGQYGAYLGGLEMITSVYANPNVLNNGATFNTTNNWQNPSTPYMEPDGATQSYVNVAGVPTLPEDLDYATFIANWKPSWRASLLPYHPEYCYKEYYDELCSEVYTINSEDYTTESFDAVLLNIHTYAEATNTTTNLFNVNLTTDVSTVWNVQNIDPFFNLTATEYTFIDAVSYGTVDALDLMSDLMNAVLNDYHGEGMTLFEFAIMTVACGTDLNGPCTPPAIGSLTTAQKDQVWTTFKNLYLSEKKKINQFFLDLHAIKNECHNGFIGDSGPGSSILAFVYYPSLLDDAVDLYDGVMSTVTLPYLPPWFFTGGVTPSYTHFFEDKIQRFIPISNLYNGGVPEDVAIEELQADADAGFYYQTGQCPLALDVQIFLDGLAQGDYFDNNDIPSSSVPQLTADLFVEMGGTIPNGSAVEIDHTINGSSNLEIIVSGTTDQIILNPPTGLAWSNYGSTWLIEGMSMMYYVPGSLSGTVYSFEILAQINQGGTITEVVMTGTTDGIEIGECDLEQPCERRDNLGNDLINLFIWLEAEGELANTSTTVPLDGLIPWYEYSELQMQLADFASDFEYDGTAGSGSFDIAATDYAVTVDFGGSFPADMDLITGGTFDGTTLTIYYIDIYGAFLSASATVKLTDLSVPQLISFDLDCGCGAENEFESGLQNILNALLNEYNANGTPADGFNLPELQFMEPNIDFANPAIYNFVYTTSTFGFSLSNEDNCLLAFQDTGSATITNLVAVYNLQVIHTNGTPSSITCTGLLSNGTTVFLESTETIRCWFFTDCDNCIPQPVQPVSCTDAYDTYDTEITTLNNTILTAPDPDLDPEDATLFPEYTEEEFCDQKLAYVTAAYLHYLDVMLIANADDDHYLTIAEFGNTWLNYGFDDGTDDLSAVVDDFETYEDTHAGFGWNEYVNTIYMNLSVVCPPNPMPIPLPDTLIVFPCEQLTQNADTVNQVTQYEIYLNNTIESFKQRYIEAGISSLIENFTMEFPDKEYHYTLYYYDQAGNLVQTVPPAGVDRIEQEIVLADVNAARSNNTTPDNTTPGTANVLPEHTMATNYRYNSLNQLITQNTPDGGTSYFAYDVLGRLVVSQNAKQLVNNQMSYTKYDDLGRIIEVGEMDVTASTYTFNTNGKLVLVSGGALVDVSHPDFPENISSSREEVVVTIYDEALNATTEALFADYSDNNTRNRITGVLYFDTFTSTTDIEADYTNATFYDYDVHGNVKEVVQEIKDDDLDLLTTDETIKKTKYDYELVSGNVKEVTYQDGKLDEFHHKYTYDADNRITKVRTSANGRIWEQDAKYFYYDHGPLARVETGDKKVQATDFAYTLQGWLKGVNSEDLERTSDIGKDGVAFTLNKLNAADAFAYSLHYFDGDYDGRFDNNFLPYSESVSVTNSSSNLYNGNINEMYTTLRDNDEVNIGSSHTLYRYDQLNRIRSMDQELVTGSITVTAGKYSSDYTFDANGNLQTLQRSADIGGSMTAMDDFTYHYTTGTNQLTYVDDVIGSGVATVDVDDQAANNYLYDEIGQLTTDVSEQIDDIEWTVTGKVKRITRDNLSSFSDLEFTYDAMGNRIVKAEYDNSGNLIQKTFYFMDAQGNVMSIYTLKEESLETNLYLAERNLYGSSRLGVENINKVIASSDAGNITMTTDTNRFVGDKLYEMSNHLGNVLVTVTDRKLPEAVTVDHLCFATASSEYAITSSFAAGLSTKMTLEGWVKTTGTGNYTVAAYYDGGVNKGMVLGISGGLPVITGRNGTASGYVIWGTSNLADGNWHHVVATSDNGVWTIYADGQVENTFTSAAGGFTSMNEPFFIGANMYGAYIDGCIKEVSFWNYAKAASEVNTDYVNYDGYTGSETGIIGYWKCDEGTGTSLDDLTSGNHNASLINTPTWSSDDYIAYNMPDVQSYSDYYPFGMQLPGRNGSVSDYKYGFNGMEKDDEVKGDGNSYDFGARIYDPRIGKFLSTDPKEFIYPWQSSYVFAANNPIKLIDINGENPGEPDQKEEKFRKNVLVVKTQEEYDLYSADPKNKNWKIIYATSLQDAQQQMGAYLEKHGEKHFNNIVIRSHGDLGYTTSAVNDSQTGQSVSKSGGLAIGLDDDYTDKGALGPNLNINAGLLMADHVKKDYTTSGGATATVETVQALKIIGTYAKNSVVFTGCLAAYGTDNIIKAISGLPEYKGVKVYGNTDKSSVLPFNTELTNEANYSGGFRLYVDGVLQEEHIGLIMSTFDNYPIYTYNKKGKRKAA